MIRSAAYVTVLALWCAAFTAQADETRPSDGGAAERGSRSPALYAGFSGYARKVTTDSPEAQRWFDQGIQLLYGFNHDEAIRSFEKAAEIDPACAMAWWGSAYARGLHINNPEMKEEQSRLADEAARKAVEAGATSGRPPTTGPRLTSATPRRWRPCGTSSRTILTSERCSPNR